MMLEAFSRILAEDAELRQALDYTFYIIKVWDVDGVRLNEPWFKGPFSITITCVTSSVRRPRARWTGPFQLTIKTCIFMIPFPKRARCKFNRSAAPPFSVLFAQLRFWRRLLVCNQPLEKSFYDRLRGVAAGQHMPIDLGEPEGAVYERLSPAVYRNISMADTYDYYEAYGQGASGRPMRLRYLQRRLRQASLRRLYALNRAALLL